jgi:DNA polymerase-3 subunit epsilon
LSGYTVVDLETTGLFPQQHDRVVEIGVVFVSDDATIEGEWSTLVNPQRDVGPTHIHGVHARDVLTAPTFADLAPALLQAMRRRTLVAHNARFDLRFLEYEFERLGLCFDSGHPTGLCTMQWAPRYLHAGSRKLIDCCSAAGISLISQHEALCDARATAELLIHLMGLTGPPPPWTRELEETRAFTWPEFHGPISEVGMVVRRVAAPVRPNAGLDRIVAGMPHWDDIRVESYLEVLESALLDQYLSAHEEQALIETAVGLGIERSLLDDIHRQYLASMAAVALADGVVTVTERADLETVAALLGLSDQDIDSALANAEPQSSQEQFALKAGDCICLTGAMSRERSDWEAIAAAHGVQVGGLTKKTRVLVAADPDSQSGKAAKARAYGIPIVTEQALSRLLGCDEPRLARQEFELQD